MDGIFNIHKPTGITSHDVVARMRRLLQQRSVGHAGTLDPAASGVLPICTGQATRVADYLSESGKEYLATIICGIETDTYDAEGAITRTASTEHLSLDEITRALGSFRGRVMQVPPRYSAIKIQGQAAYKRARAGEAITLEARPVEITRLEITSWQNPTLVLNIACSKGTYIRSLAYDLGRELGCGAHLGGLIRIRSGPFRLEESVTLEELASAAEQNELARYAQPIDKALEQYPALHLTDAETERVKHGNAFAGESPHDERALARVYDAAGNFIAIVQWQQQAGTWHPRKVFRT
ncbi:MAG TPA: tRNA pseudouridine(55) synthase TruB [Ktedonobacteraceae bacterium]|nr:tRNA pseudouridine(55) synthase TruB [Ktedonobacteraceae bacterium]